MSGKGCSGSWPGLKQARPAPTVAVFMALLCSGTTGSRAAPALPGQEPSADARGGGAIVLPEVVVASTKGAPPPAYAGGQVARGGRVGLLGNKDFMDTPFSVASYTEKTIRDEQAQSVAEVLSNSDPAVRTSIGSTNRYDALTIRGFRVDNHDFALDGLYGLVADYRVNPVPVERIELLRGPAALLYGISPFGAIGGTVNIVTKQAPDVPLTRFTTFYASTSRAGESVDVARRYGDQKQLGIRVNGSLVGGDTTINRQKSRNGALSVALDYRGERFRLYQDVIYQNDVYTAQSRGYLPTTGIFLPAAPDPRLNVAQNFDYADASSVTELTRAEYDLTPTTTLFGAVGVNRFFYHKQEAPGATLLDPFGDATSTSTFQYGGTLGVSANLGGRTHFDTGPVKHEVVVSANSLDQTSWLGQTLFAPYATNIYAPVLLPTPGVATSIAPLAKSSTDRPQSVGVADTLSVLDEKIALTVGVRRQEVAAANFTSTGAVSSSFDAFATSPSVALVVRPTRELSFYGNFIQGLTVLTSPSSALNPNQLFPPSLSTQYEVGTKLDLGLIAATLAFFQITQAVGTVDPTSLLFSVDGQQRNRGIEITTFGELREGLRVLGGVTLLDPRLTKTAGGLYNGRYGIGAPTFQGNVGLEWDTPFVRGLTAIGRVIYTGGAYASMDNLQRVPDWATLDLGLRYATRVADHPTELRATVANVLDHAYWIANPTGYLISGPPRTLLVSMSTDF